VGIFLPPFALARRSRNALGMLAAFTGVLAIGCAGKLTDASDGDGGADAASCGTGPCDDPPSCAPGGDGLTNCNTGSESCCTSLAVPGGTYDRSYPFSGNGPRLGDPATVSGFRLDKYEVTVGRFRQFVRAWNGGWTPAAGSGKHSYLNDGRGLADVSAEQDAGTVYERGWDPADDSDVSPTDSNLASCGIDSTWTPSAAASEKLPIGCVNWYEAYAFCIWDGGFLPTEAEWEYAAVGGSQQREYPWGSAAPGTENQYSIYGCYYPSGSGVCDGTVSHIAPVGTPVAGAGTWGQLDLAGNVSEWTLDSFAPDYVSPCTDGAYLASSSDRVSRGGFAEAPAIVLTGAVRSPGPPTSRIVGGIRCARAP